MLFTAIAGSAVILVTWLILIAACVGIGLLVVRVTGAGITADALFASFWLGLILTTAFLQVWHLVLPIASATVGIVIAVGGASLAWNGSRLAAWLKGSCKHPNAAVLIAMLIGALWVANRATSTVVAFDTGMYHIPAVTWAKQYSIVPGLANLHGRLGFNNSSLLLATMVDVGPWINRASHLLNGLFVAVFLAEITYRLAALVGGKPPRDASTFDLVLLTPLVVIALDPWYVSSLTTDLPTGIVLLAASSRAVRLMGRRCSDPRTDSLDLVTITGLCALAVCFKLSAAVFAALLWIVVAAWYLYTHRHRAGELKGPIAWSVALSLALMVPWICRGVALSGYPFYPSTFAGAPVDWRVPAEQAEAEAAWIGHFARHYYSSQAYNSLPFSEGSVTDWRWLGPWVRGSLAHASARWLVVAPLGLAVGAALSGVALRFRWNRAVTGWWLLFIPILGGLTLWFLEAPRPNFGFFNCWALAGICGTLALGRALETATMRTARLMAAAAISIACLPLLNALAGKPAGSNQTTVRQLLGTIFVLPPQDHAEAVRRPIELRSYTTAFGLRVEVPARNNQCWFAEPLCTPHPAPNLRLRRLDHPQSGFVVEGEWQATRWPNPETAFLASWRASRTAR